MIIKFINSIILSLFFITTTSYAKKYDWRLEFSETKNNELLWGHIIGSMGGYLYGATSLQTRNQSGNGFPDFSQTKLYQIDHNNNGKIIKEIELPKNVLIEAVDIVDGFIIVKTLCQTFIAYDWNLNEVWRNTESSPGIGNHVWSMSGSYRGVNGRIYSLVFHPKAGISLTILSTKDGKTETLFPAERTPLDRSYILESGLMIFSGWQWGNIDNHRILAIDVITGKIAWENSDQSQTKYVYELNLAYHNNERVLFGGSGKIFSLKDGQLITNEFKGSPLYVPSHDEALKGRRSVRCAPYNICEMSIDKEEEKESIYMGKSSVTFSRLGQLH